MGNDVPGNAWYMGTRKFSKEIGQIILLLRDSPVSPLADVLQEVFKDADLSTPRSPLEVTEHLILDVERVVARENDRGLPESDPFVRMVFFALCWTLDRLYEGRPIQKFWVLETVARIPYFSYITALHFYESLGWWRTPQLRDIHIAEENNELHHLLIMESLGGNTAWFDRFFAQNSAIVYYWVVLLAFLVNPSLSYNFSVLVEEHAYCTYAEFVDANEDILRQIPPPPVAVQYYSAGDLYNFDKFQTSRSGAKSPRRPPCDNMLDVFKNIRDDEHEHFQTMAACQQWWAGKGPSPLPEVDRKSFGDREAWLDWSAKVNALRIEPLR